MQMKLKDKNCDWIIANDVSKEKGFNSEFNEVTITIETPNRK